MTGSKSISNSFASTFTHGIVLVSMLLSTAVFAQEAASSLSGIVVLKGSSTPATSGTVEFHYRGPFPRRYPGPNLLKTAIQPDGRFQIDGVPPGLYDLTGRGNGYIKWMNWNHGDRELQIEVVAGQHMRALRVEYYRGGSISGKLLDEYGSPLLGATVTVVRVSESGHKLRSDYPQEEPYTLHSVGVVPQAKTNSLGEYRLEGLAPGHYLLRAWRPSFPTEAAKAMYFAPLAARLPDLQGRAPADIHQVYYPEAWSAANAKPVPLSHGAAVSGIEIRFPLVAGTILRGTVKLPDGSDPRSSIDILPADSLLERNQPKWQTYSDRTGRFSTPPLPPGLYRIDVSTNPPSSDYRPLVQTIQVGHSPIREVSVSFERTGEISGELGGMQLLPSGTASIVSILLERIERIDGESAQDLVAAKIEDGKLHFKQLPPGMYTVRAHFSSSGPYLRHARIGQHDLLSAPFRFVPGENSQQAYFEVALDSGAIDLTIAGEPQPGKRLMYLYTHPANGVKRDRTFRSLHSIQPGIPLRPFTGIAPGIYKLLLFSEEDRAELTDEEIVERTWANAPEVTVQPNQTVQVKMTWKPLLDETSPP